MLIRLKRIDRKEDESIMFNFPYEESEISNVYNQLDLETATAPNSYIDGVVYDLDMNKVLKGKECNIDELNFLFKRMDSFDTKERKVFFASAFAENTETVAELINLSFNTHCYSLVSDFNNLDTVGKDLYLSEKQAVATKELEELDGETFAMEVIKTILILQLLLMESYIKIAMNQSKYIMESSFPYTIGKKVWQQCSWP